MPNWNEVLDEISKTHENGDNSAFDTVRRKYLHQLYQHTGRNIIAYYSGYSDKANGSGYRYYR